MPETDDVLVYHLYQQGRERLEGGDPRGAAEVLELAVEREPEKASLHETLARAYFATARIGPALEAFGRALDLDPTDAYAHFCVGRCYEREGRVHEAVKHYRLACALSPREVYHERLARLQAS